MSTARNCTKNTEVFAKVAHNGTVLEWHVSGVSVLASLSKNQAGEPRGGLPLCVPMFSVQQRAVAGCQLPLHGVLTYQKMEPKTTLLPSESWKQTHAFKATETFAWDWSVHLSVDLTEDSLRYSIKVERHADCQNKNEMPLSLGFHPYFNTFGQDFSFVISDKEYTKASLPKNIIDSAFAPLKNNEAAVLRTAAGTLALTPSGYDEYCLWTDHIDEYICIEPIYQYREFGLPGTGLKPGEAKDVTCALAFKLKS